MFVFFPLKSEFGAKEEEIRVFCELALDSSMRGGIVVVESHFFLEVVVGGVVKGREERGRLTLEKIDYTNNKETQKKDGKKKRKRGIKLVNTNQHQTVQKSVFVVVCVGGGRKWRTNKREGYGAAKGKYWPFYGARGPGGRIANYYLWDC